MVGAFFSGLGRGTDGFHWHLSFLYFSEKSQIYFTKLWYDKNGHYGLKFKNINYVFIIALTISAIHLEGNKYG